MMKKLFLLLFRVRKEVVLILLVSGCLQLKAQLSTQIISHKSSARLATRNFSKRNSIFNLSSFSLPKMYKNMERLYSINNHSYVPNPDFGKIAPGVNPSWY